MRPYLATEPLDDQLELVLGNLVDERAHQAQGHVLKEETHMSDYLKL